MEKRWRLEHLCFKCERKVFRMHTLREDKNSLRTKKRIILESLRKNGPLPADTILTYKGIILALLFICFY